MHQYTYYYLVIRYPSLRSYINKCHMMNHVAELFDFLFALETDGPERNV